MRRSRGADVVTAESNKHLQPRKMLAHQPSQLKQSSSHVSCFIDATERHNVATIGIPGMFMDAEMDKLLHMRLEGTMAKQLVKPDPKLHWKDMQTVETADVKTWGFEVNPYARCVTNKTPK